MVPSSCNPIADAPGDAHAPPGGLVRVMWIRFPRCGAACYRRCVHRLVLGEHHRQSESPQPGPQSRLRLRCVLTRAVRRQERPRARRGARSRRGSDCWLSVLPSCATALRCRRCGGRRGGRRRGGRRQQTRFGGRNRFRLPTDRPAADENIPRRDATVALSAPPRGCRPAIALRETLRGNQSGAAETRPLCRSLDLARAPVFSTLRHVFAAPSPVEVR